MFDEQAVRARQQMEYGSYVEGRPVWPSVATYDCHARTDITACLEEIARLKQAIEAALNENMATAVLKKAATEQRERAEKAEQEIARLREARKGKVYTRPEFYATEE